MISIRIEPLGNVGRGASFETPAVPRVGDRISWTDYEGDHWVGEVRVVWWLFPSQAILVRCHNVQSEEGYGDDPILAPLPGHSEMDGGATQG